MSHSPRYRNYINSPKWKKKSKFLCTIVTGGRCVLFPWLRSSQGHHLTYRNLENEWAIRDVVPLSPIAHKIVHLPLFWKTPLRAIVTFWLRVSTIGWLFGGVGWIALIAFILYVFLR